MTFKVNDKVLAQLSGSTGKKISPLLSGTVIAIDGTKCTIKWSNTAIASCAMNIFRSNDVDEKYLTLA